MCKLFETLFSKNKMFARRKQLDKLVEFYGLKRNRYYFIFRESDKNLRKRVLETIKSYK